MLTVFIWTLNVTAAAVLCSLLALVNSARVHDLSVTCALDSIIIWLSTVNV